MLRDAESIREAIGCTVVSNLKRMARMGVFLEQNVRERYPEFPVAGGVRSWEEYLPPLNPGAGGPLRRAYRRDLTGS